MEQTAQQTRAKTTITHVPVTKGDFQELKSLSAPPEVVKTVLSAAMTLVGKQGEWRFVKKALGDGSLQNAMGNSTVSKESAEKAKAMLEGLSEDKVKKVSMAAASVYRWDVAVVNKVLQN